MNFLNMDDVVVLGKSSDVDVFVLESCAETKDPTRPLASKAVNRNIDKRVPAQPDSLYSWR